MRHRATNCPVGQPSRGFRALIICGLLANSASAATAATPEPPAPISGPATDRLRLEISQKKALAAEVWTAVGRINSETHVGTAFNEIDVERHTCFILGNLLGLPHSVAHLEVKHNPDLTTATNDNALRLRVMHLSMENYAAVASSLLQHSTEELRLQWNLDCAGKQGILELRFPDADVQTFYKITNEGQVLRVLGPITSGFAQKLIAAIQANPGVQTVALGSGGGYVDEALRAGLYIRHMGMDTTLWNNCLSACPLVLLGGVKRSSWAPHSDLGFHQIARAHDGIAIPRNADLYRTVANYIAIMGADSQYVISLMWAATPADMLMVEGDDSALCDAGVFTWIQRVCDAKVDQH